ncbi:hypothetical protein CFH99_18465 [Nocardioides aromaticivorans]|uniref:Glycosyl hydrolase n=1 Tax=Nocardioides aromaticivorans TaxID=200618 RepID=A0ABX7PNX7_9ACTN|nr:hypothetical protein [Nocardioides aromaticivorans]QSR27611.1 hypothetical protein CFH99_18465 [Nocardioides aromaticivorans]
MTDVDQLFGDDDAGVVARQAAEAATVPDFAVLARRGRARRTRRQAAAVGAAALAVAGVMGVVQVVGGGDTSGPPDPVGPGPTTTTAGTSEAALAAFVDGQDGPPLALAVAPGDTDAMATLWQDGEVRDVLAVTDDGFATRRLIELPSGSRVTAGPEGRFVVRRGWDDSSIALVSTDGREEAVRISGAEGPLAAGEVPVDTLDPDTAEHRLVAVGSDGTGHPVTAPDGLQQVTWFGLRLAGFASAADGVDYHWSDDGGTTWQRHHLSGPFLPGLVLTAAGQDHAVIEGGDGATLFPLDVVDRAPSATPADWTRTTIDVPDSHVTTTAAWLQDGEVRVLATRWDDIGQGFDAGVWRVVGDTLEPVASDQPGVTGNSDAAPLLVEYLDGPVLWVPGADGEVWRSADGGGHWERFATR